MMKKMKSLFSLYAEAAAFHRRMNPCVTYSMEVVSVPHYVVERVCVHLTTLICPWIVFFVTGSVIFVTLLSNPCRLENDSSGACRVFFLFHGCRMLHCALACVLKPPFPVPGSISIPFLIHDGPHVFSNLLNGLKTTFFYHLIRVSLFSLKTHGTMMTTM